MVEHRQNALWFQLYLQTINRILLVSFDGPVWKRCYQILWRRERLEPPKPIKTNGSRPAWVPPITSCYPREAIHASLAAAHLASRDSAFWTATTARSATRNALFAYSRAILAMVSALLHASSKCLPVKNCSDNVESIWDTGSRQEALLICTRATVGARQRLWVSQVWFLDPGFFVHSG